MPGGQGEHQDVIGRLPALMVPGFRVQGSRALERWGEQVIIDVTVHGYRFTVNG